MTDRARAGVSAAVAVTLLLGAVVAVVILGRISPPQLPALARQPLPGADGRVAYLVEDGGEAACVAVADLSDGERQVLGCPPGPLHRVRLVGGDGEVVVAAEGAAPGGRRVLTFDAGGLVDERLVTDAAGPHRLAPGDAAERADGARVLPGYGGDAAITVVGGDGQVLARRDFDHGDYAVVRARWSDDGRWVLLWDNAGRLLVGDERLQRLRVVADDVRA